MEHIEELKREKNTLEKEKLNPLKEKVEKLSGMLSLHPKDLQIDENSTLDRRRRKLEDELKEIQKSWDDEVKTRYINTEKDSLQDKQRKMKIKN